MLCDYIMTGQQTDTDSRVPATLLTGFLGAGKATVLNGLLADPGAERVAVIVNEFGEAGLDHDLIEAVDEEIVLMQSGCLCCSVRGDLSRVIGNLLARRAAGTLDFTRVLIETTGLAEPGPILQTFLVDPDLAQNVRMDGVVTVADAATGQGTLNRQFEAVSQIAMADLVILSKADLVTPEAAARFEARIAGLNPAVRILRAVRGEVPQGSLWGLSALRLGAKPGDAMAWLSRSEPKADPLANLSGLTPQAESKSQHSPHDARICSASIVLDEPVPDVVFDLWLESLVALRGPDILRIKGIVHIEDLPKPFVFHGVQHVFDPPLPVEDWPGGDTQSRIVVIARDITRPELQQSLDILRSRLPRGAGAETKEEGLMP